MPNDNIQCVNTKAEETVNTVTDTDTTTTNMPNTREIRAHVAICLLSTTPPKRG